MLELGRWSAASSTTSPNGDAGLWVGVVTGTRKTHIIFFCGRVLMFCHSHEAITTLSPMLGQAALRGGEWLLPPGRHCPGRVLPRLPLHRRAAGRVLLRICQRRSGRHTNLARHRTVALFLRYFRSIPQVGRRRCCGGDVQRVASSSSVSSAASSSCRWVTLRIYHRRSGVTCKLTRHRAAASILRYFRSIHQVVRPAAALGSRAAYPSSLKVIVGSSQDISHDLACSSVFVGVFFFC